MAKLPQGVWAVIANILAEEGGDDQWMIRKANRWQIHREWTPLRALTQVNRAARAAAMPAMWRHVKLNARNENFPKILQLAQLRRELSFGSVNSKSDITYTSKLPLGPRAYVETIELDFRLDEPGPAAEGQRRKCREQADVYEQAQLVFKGENLRQASSGTRPSCSHCFAGNFPTLLESFMVNLTACPLLKSFTWRGAIPPSEKGIRALLRCDRLQTLNLDLRGICFEGKRSTFVPRHVQKQLIRARLIPPCLDLAEDYVFPRECKCEERALSAPKVTKLRHMSLGLGTVRNLNGSDTEADQFPYTEDWMHTEAGIALADWILKINSLQSLDLAAPDLLHKPWMLPTWAYITNLKEWTIPGDEPGDDLEESDGLYWMAAKSFHKLLETEVWQPLEDKFKAALLSRLKTVDTPSLPSTPHCSSSQESEDGSPSTASLASVVTHHRQNATLSLAPALISTAMLPAIATPEAASTAVTPRTLTQRRLLSTASRNGPSVDEALEYVAQRVFGLIHCNKTLKVWRRWFPVWHITGRVPFENLASNTILTKVAEVLADRNCNTSDKRGMKRKRLDSSATATDYWFPCEDEGHFSDDSALWSIADSEDIGEFF